MEVEIPYHLFRYDRNVVMCIPAFEVKQDENYSYRKNFFPLLVDQLSTRFGCIHSNRENALRKRNTEGKKKTDEGECEKMEAIRYAIMRAVPLFHAHETPKCDL